MRSGQTAQKDVLLEKALKHTEAAYVQVIANRLEEHLRNNSTNSLCESAMKTALSKLVLAWKLFGKNASGQVLDTDFVHAAVCMLHGDRSADGVHRQYIGEPVAAMAIEKVIQSRWPVVANTMLLSNEVDNLKQFLLEHGKTAPAEGNLWKGSSALLFLSAPQVTPIAQWPRLGYARVAAWSHEYTVARSARIQRKTTWRTLGSGRAILGPSPSSCPHCSAWGPTT